MIESGLLKVLLLDIIFGGAAGVAIWRFIESKAGQKLRDRLASWLGYFGLEPPEVTHYLAMTLSVVALLAIYSVAQMFAFAFNAGIAASIAYATSQILHARRKTRLALRQRMHPIDPTTTTLD